MSVTETATEYIQPSNEHKLQVMVVEYIKVAGKPHVRAIAITNEGRRSYNVGMRMKRQGLIAGAADLLIALPGGRCAWLEMKTLKGRQSAEQKEFQAWCLAIGHPYAVARSFDDATKILRLWGALK